MSASPPPRALLLDLGHTLVRWEVEDALLREAYREAHDLLLAAAPEREPAPDAVWELRQQVLDALGAAYRRGELDEQDHLDLWTAALAAQGYTLDRAAAQALVAREHAIFARHLAVSPATHHALRTLRERGYRLGLVSNVSLPGALMRQTVTQLGIADRFEVMVFSSEIGVRKPHPRIYYHVLDALGATPAEAVFVGDRVREDIVGPQALGIRAVLCNEHRQEPLGSATPDATIAAFADLPAVLTAWRR